MNTFLYIHSFNSHINPYYNTHFKNKETGTQRSHLTHYRNMTSMEQNWRLVPPPLTPESLSLSILGNNTFLEQIMVVSVIWDEK